MSWYLESHQLMFLSVHQDAMPGCRKSGVFRNSDLFSGYRHIASTFLWLTMSYAPPGESPLTLLNERVDLDTTVVTGMFYGTPILSSLLIFSYH